jgi:NAD(P)-dependent dehydrogenase (short-subunit alcohol dehydrogenase family)
MCPALALDVIEPSQVKAAVAHAAATFGRIDVIVNNAGEGLVSALEELSDEHCISLGNMPMTSKRASLATRWG